LIGVLQVYKVFYILSLKKIEKNKKKIAKKIDCIEELLRIWL